MNDHEVGCVPFRNENLHNILWIFHSDRSEQVNVH